MLMVHAQKFYSNHSTPPRREPSRKVPAQMP